MTDEERLCALGERLRALGYSFVTVTPSTHGRVLARGSEPRRRPDRAAPDPAFGHPAASDAVGAQSPPGKTLRDIFGWSKPFAEGALPQDLFELLGPFLVRERDLWKSAVRYSSLQDMLFAHSAFPTVESDAVFFGPDTYRFASLLHARIESARNVADVGCGSGAGGILLAPRSTSVQLLDVNPRALQFASANAALNGASVRTALSDVLSGAEGPLDLVVANPPYLADDLRRAYRDGGGALGTALSARICEEALDRLEPSGRLVLYTATPVVEGRHVLWAALEPLLRNARFDYRELDPDVFGEELQSDAYSDVERIAVVALDAFKL